MFSLDGPEGLRFLTRSRLFTETEWAKLATIENEAAPLVRADFPSLEEPTPPGAIPPARPVVVFTPTRPLYRKFRPRPDRRELADSGPSRRIARRSLSRHSRGFRGECPIRPQARAIRQLRCIPARTRLSNRSSRRRRSLLPDALNARRLGRLRVVDVAQARSAYRCAQWR
jgi:hypothetical protein